MDKGADDAALPEYLARCLGKIHLCSVDRQNVGSGLASASEPVSDVNKLGRKLMLEGYTQGKTFSNLSIMRMKKRKKLSCIFDRAICV